MQDKTNPFAFYAGLHLLFAFYANIVKGECRDKRELYFRFDYAEPNPIFVFTNIAKGESKDKRKSHFRLGYTEPHPIFVVTNIKKVTYTTNGAPHFFRQIGQYLTFIARTTILHRQLFFYPHGLNKKKEKSFLIFFVLLRYENFDLLIGSQGMVPPMESP